MTKKAQELLHLFQEHRKSGQGILELIHFKANAADAKPLQLFAVIHGIWE